MTIFISSSLRISIFINLVLFTRGRILTNETQSTVPLSYSLIYIGCVKRLLCKFVRNHSLIRYSLHCDWLLPSTDLKGHSRLRWLCKPINAHDVPTHHLTCVTHESKSPTALHIDIPILAICRKFFTMDLVKRRSLRRVFYRLVVERPKCYLQLEGLIESTQSALFCSPSTPVSLNE